MFFSTHGSAERADGRTGARRLAAINMTVAIVVTLSAVAGAEGQPLVSVREDDGGYRVAATFSVTQSPAVAIATLTDFPQIPRFMPAVQTSTVVERADGRTVVKQEAVARFLMFSKRVHLILEVETTRGVIRFRDTSGSSFERYEGSWTIAEERDTTRIMYELLAKPTFEVPGFLLKRLLKRDAAEMIDRLKVEIARRSG